LLADCPQTAQLFNRRIFVPDNELWWHNERCPAVCMAAVVPSRIEIWLTEVLLAEATMLPHLHGALAAGTWRTNQIDGYGFHRGASARLNRIRQV
jgi:hypothetical protein